MEVVRVVDSKSLAVDNHGGGSVGGRGRGRERLRDELRVKKKTLQAVLDQCHEALQSLQDTDYDDKDEEEVDEDPSSPSPSSETNELCSLLKSRVESPNFLEKLGSVYMSTEEGSSWDMVNKNDLWDGDNIDPEQEGFVFVKQEDIVDGIACFMATYLLSLQDTKELTPKQLQEALSKTFSVKKKKGKLQKAWDGSKVVYNVASWGATAIGIYQNPAILRAATTAFWGSCHIISKLL